MHEPGCIAETLSSKEPLSFDEKLLFAKHLLKLCRRDYDKIFLPNERLLVSKSDLQYRYECTTWCLKTVQVEILAVQRVCEKAC